jgi:hypothetical protein
MLKTVSFSSYTLVEGSANVLSWTCATSPYANFTVLYVQFNANSFAFTLVCCSFHNRLDYPTFAAPLAFIGIEYNYTCSQEISQDQVNQTAGPGYTILFANPLNDTDVRQV